MFLDARGRAEVGREQESDSPTHAGASTAETGTRFTCHVPGRHGLGPYDHPADEAIRDLLRSALTVPSLARREFLLPERAERYALGHSSIATTQVYLSRVGAHEAVDAMKNRHWSPE